jgi:mxaK protein
MARLTRWTTAIAWALLAFSLGALVVFGWRWHDVRRVDAMIAARTIHTLAASPDDPRVRYAIAWNLEREQKLDEAAKQYIETQANAPPRLAADAAFALGNVYFAAGVRASRAATPVDGPQPELAEFELARDAYRSALRIDPQLYGARYNLELLERMAPTRPTDGWRRNTDPVKIQADKHNGWTTIRETKKRGLP